MRSIDENKAEQTARKQPQAPAAQRAGWQAALIRMQTLAGNQAVAQRMKATAGDVRAVQRQERHWPRPPQPTPAPPPVRRIVVDLAAQSATAIEGNRTVRRMRITSGMPGHPTHTGDNFRLSGPRPENAEHRSSSYGQCIARDGSHRKVGPGGAANCRHGERYVGALMRHFQPFNGPEGFHEGSLSAPSHGCLHLSAPDAAWLWSWGRPGIRVEIRSGTRRRRPNERIHRQR